jgi:hypothetical protein
LGSPQTFNRFIVRWETAFGSQYFVGWSDDNRTYTGYWRTLSSKQDDTISFGAQAHRWVGIYMTQRAPRMNNYSFWEYEVYNAATAQASNSQSGDKPATIEHK